MNDFSCRRQRGFTLIETAVSLLVLATGLLGMAFLQTRAMQYGVESQNRTIINLLVAGMADRMRANRIPATAAAAAAYTDPITLQELEQTCTPDGTTNTPPRHDTTCFYKTIAAQVPSSMMEITTDAEFYEIRVYWSDHQLSQGDLGSSNADGSINRPECIAQDNRAWSGDLTWPGSQEDPTLMGPTNVCLVSHSWRFRVAGV